MGLGETHAEGVEFGEEPPASRHRGKRLKRRTVQKSSGIRSNDRKS